MQQTTFQKGYKYFTDTENIGATLGADRADAYVGRIDSSCADLGKNLNAFQGFETDIRMLKGDVFEFHSSGTFNIAAAVKDSPYRTFVDRSHDYASADVIGNWGEEFGLKACFNGTASAKAQSISHFQRFMEYKSLSGRSDLSFEDFLLKQGLSSNDILSSDSIYMGQTRIIPSDQLEEAVNFLKRQIDRKSITNPDEVQKLQETLNKLKACIEAPDGTKSIPITTEELKTIAASAKKGEYDAAADGFTPEQLIKIEHIVNQGIKSGLTAATISMVLRVAPEIYRCLDELISEGHIDEEQLKELGFSALGGATEGFLRGFVSASITTSCKSGILGETLKGVSPEIIGALTVVMMNTMKDSFLLSKGSLTKNEFTYNLQRNIFVTACGLGGGALLQATLPMIPFAYLLGNFVGSMVGSFAFVAYDNAVLSYCIASGSTFFGIVDQNYQLPENVLKELGVSFFDYEQYLPDHFEYDIYQMDTFDYDRNQADMIYKLRRGVIGIRQVGYI